MTKLVLKEGVKISDLTKVGFNTPRGKHDPYEVEGMEYGKPDTMCILIDDDRSIVVFEGIESFREEDSDQIPNVLYLMFKRGLVKQLKL